MDILQTLQHENLVALDAFNHLAELRIVKTTSLANLKLQIKNTKDLMVKSNSSEVRQIGLNNIKLYRQLYAKIR